MENFKLKCYEFSDFGTRREFSVHGIHWTVLFGLFQQSTDHFILQLKDCYYFLPLNFWFTVRFDLFAIRNFITKGFAVLTFA